MFKKITVSNFGAIASDGNQLFTPTQSLRRLWRFTKLNNKIILSPPFKGEEITDLGWTRAKQAIQKSLIGKTVLDHYTKQRGPNTKQNPTA